MGALVVERHELLLLAAAVLLARLPLPYLAATVAALTTAYLLYLLVTKLAAFKDSYAARSKQPGAALPGAADVDADTRRGSGLDIEVDEDLEHGEDDEIDSDHDSDHGHDSDQPSDDGDEDDTQGEDDEEDFRDGREPRWMRAMKGLKLLVDGTEIAPNTVVPFDNEFASGRFLMLCKGEPTCPTWSEYWATPNPRAFQIQFQVRFKKLPNKHILYTGSDLETKPRVSAIMSSVVRMIMAFACRILPGIHWSLGDRGYSLDKDEEMERPHVMLRVATAMDRIVRTRDGGELPPMGMPFPEPDDARDKRRGGGTPVEYDLQHTYSFSYISNIFDFPNWRCVNLPTGDTSFHSLGIRKFGIAVYDLVDPGNPRHNGANRRTLFRFQMDYDDDRAQARATPGGRYLSPSIALAAAPPAELAQTRIRTASFMQAQALVRTVRRTVSHDTLTALGADNDDAYAFVHPGVPLPVAAVMRFQSFDQSSVGGHERGDEVQCMCDSKGYAVLQQRSMPTELKFVKVRGTASTAICGGDIVLVQSGDSGKYLSQVRTPGFNKNYKRVVWVNKARKKGTDRIRWRQFLCEFAIEGIRAGEPLSAGQSFGLRSRKWRSMVVCVRNDGSTKLGGRMLCLARATATDRRRRVLTLRVASLDDEWAPAVIDYEPHSPDLSAAGGAPALASPAAGGAQRDAASAYPPPAVEVAERCERAEVSVIAWIEMMNRKDRRAQLAYLAKATVFQTSDEAQAAAAAAAAAATASGGGAVAPPDGADPAPPRSWVSLQTGASIARVVALHRENVSATKAGVVSVNTTPRRMSAHMKMRAKLMQEKLLKALKRGNRASSHDLNPADQSVTVLSELLRDIVGEAGAASASESGKMSRRGLTARKLMLSTLAQRNELDAWFLRGASMELGVTLYTSPEPIFQSLVARAWWDTHWREECAVLYHGKLVCFAPKSKKSCWEVELRDVLSVRLLTLDQSPILGTTCIVLDTIGRCHYLCVLPSYADTWHAELTKMLNPPLGVRGDMPLLEANALFAACGLETGKYGGAPRVVLNARRFVFDPFLASTALPSLLTAPKFALDQGEQTSLDDALLALSGDLLHKVVMCSAHSATVDDFVALLDGLSALRAVDESLLDLSSPQAVGFFVNLQHALMQHASLFPEASQALAQKNLKQMRHRSRVSHSVKDSNTIDATELSPAIVSYEVLGGVYSCQELQDEWGQLRNAAHDLRTHGGRVLGHPHFPLTGVPEGSAPASPCGSENGDPPAALSPGGGKAKGRWLWSMKKSKKPAPESPGRAGKR